jgi:hypothetical protein
MHAAEIVVGEVQRNRGFQMRQLFAERIGEPRKTAHRRPHGQVLTFHKRCADVILVRPSVNDLGYDLRDSWWGVPRFGCVKLPVVAEQFHKLGEFAAASEHALNGAVEVIAVRSDLKTIFGEAPAQSVEELQRGFLGALADLEVGHQFGLLVERHKHPLVAEVRRVALANAAVLLLHERPDFVALQVIQSESAHPRVHELCAVLPRNDEQSHDRVAIEACEPFGAADRAALQKAMQRTLRRFRARSHGSKGRLGLRFGKGRLAGLAAPALNAALTEVAELLAALVLAFGAGHDFSPLDCVREKSQTQFGSGVRLTPRFGLAPTPASTEAGALICYSVIRWGACHRFLPRFSRRAAFAPLRGSYLRPKSFLAPSPTFQTLKAALPITGGGFAYFLFILHAVQDRSNRREWGAVATKSVTEFLQLFRNVFRVKNISRPRTKDIPDFVRADREFIRWLKNRASYCRRQTRNHLAQLQDSFFQDLFLGKALFQLRLRCGESVAKFRAVHTQRNIQNA